MTWVKVKWIPPLFAAFNSRWPNRTRAQDGTIGDAAHQASTSGHNPDDTAGSKAERSDADNIPEVRAADVDARGVPMQQVIDGIVASPDERRRFIYIIFNGHIWSASNGWQRQTYTGSDQHREHAHFSGHPDYDEDVRPFVTITGQQGATSMATTLDSIHNPPWGDGKPRSLANLIWETYDAFYTTGDQVAAEHPKSMPATLKRIEGKVGQPPILTPTNEQWSALVDSIGATIENLVAQKIGVVAEAAAEEAIRRVLGGLDGAVPPPPANASQG